ncbi:spore coat protein [Paenibacillus sp. MBLB4367]|uniref:spore coat protein n=1 Tax=Paenibacillus sp. MBLB4367 TaxID=3384767 RepID=UPI003907EE07
MYQQSQQQQQQQQSAGLIPEKDMLYTILADLKRSTREYATAVTESNCPIVRQTFTQLLNGTLKLQGELYDFMKRQNMYNTASPALRQEIDKQLQQYKQTEQQTEQLVSRRMSAPNEQPGGYMQSAFAQQGQSGQMQAGQAGRFGQHMQPAFSPQQGRSEQQVSGQMQVAQSYGQHMQPAFSPQQGQSEQQVPGQMQIAQSYGQHMQPTFSPQHSSQHGFVQGQSGGRQQGQQGAGYMQQQNQPPKQAPYFM